MKRLTYDPLITLVHTLDDGIEFYRIAEQKTASVHLQGVFEEMAEMREFALAYIRPYMHLHSREYQHLSGYHGTLANRYAPLLQDVLTDDSLLLVRQVEDHLIDAMHNAIAETPNALVASILWELAARVKQNLDAQLPIPLSIPQAPVHAQMRHSFSEA